MTIREHAGVELTLHTGLSPEVSDLVLRGNVVWDGPADHPSGLGAEDGGFEEQHAGVGEADQAVVGVGIADGVVKGVDGGEGSAGGGEVGGGEVGIEKGGVGVDGDAGGDGGSRRW